MMSEPMSPRDQAIWVRAEYFAMHTPFTFDEWRHFLFTRHETLSDRELFEILSPALVWSGHNWARFSDYLDNYKQLRDTTI